MKKIWRSLFVIMMAFVLVSCGEEVVTPKDNNYTPGLCNDDGFYNNTQCASSANWYEDKWHFNRKNFDGKGMTIRVYVGLAHETDPNDGNFSGTRKTEKSELLLKLEASYNVKIQFVEYPAEAAWGPSRVSWINQQKVSNTYQGDIFLVDSNWIPTLAKGQSVARIGATAGSDNLVSELKYVQNPSFYDMNKSGPYLYGYNPGTPRPDTFLYYNQDLVEAFALEDPAKMWNDNNWTWNTFLQYVQSAQVKFDADTSTKRYAFGGDYVIVAQGMVSARGYKFIDEHMVYLASDPIIETYNDLWKLYNDKYWEPAGTTTVSPEFTRSEVLFSSGGLWFLNSALRFSELDFEISAVPYPTRKDDYNKEHYHVPTGYEASWVFRPVDNGQNGLNTFTLLNIMDDYNRGLQPDVDAGTINPEEKYRLWLAGRINNPESVDAVMSVQDAPTYFEYLDIVSMTAGEGSHYNLDGYWGMNGPKIRNATNDLASRLTALAEKYRKVLESLKAEN